MVIKERERRRTTPKRKALHVEEKRAVSTYNSKNALYWGRHHFSSGKWEIPETKTLEAPTNIAIGGSCPAGENKGGGRGNSFMLELRKTKEWISSGELLLPDEKDQLQEELSIKSPQLAEPNQPSDYEESDQKRK